MFVDPKSDHETIVQLCSQCSFRTWDRVEFKVHSNYQERLKHTNIGEKSGKLRQNPPKKQVSNLKISSETKKTIAHSTDLNCDRCFFTSNKYGLKKHNSSVHEGTKFHCDQ